MLIELPTLTQITVGTRDYTVSGVTANISFGAAGEAACFQIGGQQNVAINLTGTGTLVSQFEVCFTLSEKHGGNHYDIMAAYEHRAVTTSATNSIGFVMNRGFSAPIRNGDNAETINQLDGTVTFPQSNSVTGAFLIDNEGNDVSATVTTSNNTFSITEFTLAPETSYLVFVSFHSVPNGSTSMKIDCEYVE